MSKERFETTFVLPPTPADTDVQYGTIGPTVGESQCIGKNIEYTFVMLNLTCPMYIAHRTLEGDGQTQPEPGYCV